MEFTSKVRTCLVFDNEGEEAAKFYTSLLPDSYIEGINRPDPDGPALVIEFRLSGVPYMILNAGPMFEHTPAASISVLTKDQDETDMLWNKLVSDGGQESKCSWLKDKYGVSWQIVPEALIEKIWSDDRAAAGRAQAAMMKMGKIDIATIEAAFKGQE
ncbi:MAG: VOC family protein [Kordiimonadaceae bacterium]|nr:VOC family protein [Kordiimonadaceae bacterium]